MDRVRVGVLTRNPEAWCSQRLQEALTRIGAEPVCFGFRGLIARVRLGPTVSTDGVDILRDLNAIVVRPIGRGSLEEIVFRMDVLYRLQRQGLYIINRPDAIEKAVDKYRALTILEENGVPVPRTIAAESPRNALEAFNELGGDVIVKSIFGSRGVGMTRVNDPEVAIRVFNTLALYHHVIYIQEFIPHGASDIRAFVLGDRVIASMRRVGGGWKTNVARGATPTPCDLPEDYEGLAVRAARLVGCEMAGVDILEGPDGPLVVEINSQPGWRGLQSTTKVDIAREIAGFIVGKASRLSRKEG